MVRDKCTDCRGQGRVSVKRVLTVKLPAGIHDGQAVRVSGEGEPPSPDLNPGGEGIRGDLHVVVRVAEHQRFDRDGDHLVIAMPLVFTQAALGSELEIPTLEEPTTLTVPPGTQHGTIFRVGPLGRERQQLIDRNADQVFVLSAQHEQRAAVQVVDRAIDVSTDETVAGGLEQGT